MCGLIALSGKFCPDTLLPSPPLEELLLVDDVLFITTGGTNGFNVRLA
jgi:hypothetical protein